MDVGPQRGLQLTQNLRSGAQWAIHAQREQILLSSPRRDRRWLKVEQSLPGIPSIPSISDFFFANLFMATSVILPRFSQSTWRVQVCVCFLVACVWYKTMHIYAGYRIMVTVLLLPFLEGTFGSVWKTSWSAVDMENYVFFSLDFPKKYNTPAANKHGS